MDDRRVKIGMSFFLAAEAMFFAGLISAYWVLKSQIVPWPPIGQPRLPILVTGINTGILLLSGAAITRTGPALRKGCYLCLVAALGLAALGSLLFLAIQGYEWVHLIRFGLTTVKNVYGGTFYFIIGAHALHVVAALIVLLAVFFRAIQHRYDESNHSAVTVARIFWLFVVGVWPILYALVYF